MPDYTESHSSASSAAPSLGSGSPPTTPGRSDIGDVTFMDINDHSHNRFILVIGGLGFIGSHTTLELLKSGYNVIVVDDLSNSFEVVLARIRTLAAKHFHGSGKTAPVLHFHKLDYRSRSMKFLLESYSELVESSSPVSSSGKQQQQRRRLGQRSRIAGVIHFAAFKSVSESIDKPLQYYDNNVCGLVGLLSLLAKHNIRNFVFSSSATVYGSKANEGVPLREEDLVHHPERFVNSQGVETLAEPSISGLQSPYARTKYFCEAIMADAAISDPAWRFIALRYFNPIGCDPSGLLGEDPRMVPTNLFPVITQVLTGARTELDVFGTDWDTRDGTAVRDFVHVTDVARGHVAAIDAHTDVPFRTFNLGSGTGTTVIEAVKSLEHAAARDIPVKWADRRAGDVGSCVASRERAVRELNWTPKESISQCANDLWNFVSKTKEAAK